MGYQAHFYNWRYKDASSIIDWLILFTTMHTPAKPLHNHDIVSVHFNHFNCMGICDKLSKQLSMLTYIYLNVDECWLTNSMA